MLTNAYKYIVADRPLVTALINTYNYARYLPFAINSVLNQTYPNIEIIVVDDGSTDHTREVLAQYESRISTIRTENGGQGQAFNLGIARARGELLMILDADDVWLSDKVQVMVELAARFPKAALLYHRYQNIDQHGTSIGLPQPGYLISGDWRLKYLRSGGSWWSPIASVLAIRTDHLRRVLPLPTYSVREGADTIVADYCVLTSEVASSLEVLAYRRLHGLNSYGAGREDFRSSSKATRESDVRRVEWRMFSLRQLMNRLGHVFDINLNRNAWRTVNLYLLGRASFWNLLMAYAISRQASAKARWNELKYMVALKRNSS